MKKKLVASIVFIFLLGVGNTFANVNYTIVSWTVDGGGIIFCTNGDYSLGGTLAQPDAGKVMNSSGYTLIGGFWPGKIEKKKKSCLLLFLPAIISAASKTDK